MTAGRGTGQPRAIDGAYRVALRRLVGLVTGLTAGVLVLNWAAPVVRPVLYREHQVIEWTTALAFLAAAVVGARHLSAAGAGWRDLRWIIPGLSLLAMLDEVSWGVFALGVKPPKLMDKSVDGLHDLLEVGVRWALVHAPGWVVLLVGLGIATGALTVLVRSWDWRPAFLDAVPWRFLVIAMGFGVLSQVLDVAVARDPFVQAIEEVLELNGALALLWSARFLRPRRWPGSGAPEDRALADAPARVPAGPGDQGDNARGERC